MPRANASSPDLFASDLFAVPQENTPRTLVEDAQGGIRYIPGFLPDELAAQWFDELKTAVAWEAQRRPMYDRVVDVPRLVASYRFEDANVPEPLIDGVRRVRAHLDEPFNAVGLNFYRDGNDSVAPHGDKLHMLKEGHPIALVSLGSPRRMTIRDNATRKALNIDLEPGSLLVMSHASQLTHEHGVPKTKAAVGPRISLAYRVRPPRTARG
ncbi:alpha-ketoglutarate-dependent dioxygenase AlkB family protein [Lysobacter auxotrophicus]|uniref:Alpha-ketoglutarate-dependent dioxygenase AlkB n=1 Tax=Lysobacter auxotrophicus TaxID=2992573 RepID=A0ABM8DEE9_9GAMM|nr:alpha-ketoglutarate-dependent dioxygenase AlkB [Lysobacter auxotrophicus]BDU16951.1 alpha-ketoglutarate-dependent dioxygenase AlkB [Lysobacter auxotrophicus]